MPASHSRPWQPPRAPLAWGHSASAPSLPAAPDAQRTYDLAALIDLAQENNPQTRQAWEEAKAAASRAGIAGARFLPSLALAGFGGYSRSESRTALGPVYTEGPSLTTRLVLNWTLMDFGRRDAELDSAMQELLRFNWQFNRKHQEIAYAVQRHYYRTAALQARLQSAQATVTTAQSVLAAADARLSHGLATRSDLLLARQDLARANFDLQTARRDLTDEQAALAEALGVSPAAPIKLAEWSKQATPQLPDAVEQVMESALQQRPDLAAKLAELRAREAEVRKAQSAFLPTIGLAASVGGTGGSFRPSFNARSYEYAEPIYNAFLTFSWDIFDGYAREHGVREAEARVGQAKAELDSQQLKALREVWKAYADVKAAQLQIDYAEALVQTAEDAYSGTLEGYRSGLNTIVELLAAERDLSQARTTRIDSRAELLTASAALAFASGSN